MGATVAAAVDCLEATKLGFRLNSEHQNVLLGLVGPSFYFRIEMV